MSIDPAERPTPNGLARQGPRPAAELGMLDFTSSRRVLEAGLVVGLLALAVLTGALWQAKGLAVYMEMVASGLMTCF